MKYTILTLLLVLGSLISRAQQTTPAQPYRFNLQQCIDYAYEHQDSLKNAKLDIDLADSKVKEIWGMGLPQVSGSMNLQDFLKLATSLLPGEFFGAPGTFVPVKFGVKYQSSFGINIDQIVFDGTYLLGLKASKTYKELSVRNYDRTKITVNVAVTKAYYMVLVSAEQLKLLDANISQLKQQVNETTELFKQGFAEQLAIDMLTVQLNNLVSTRDNLIRSLAFGYNVLKFQMGMPVGENLTLLDRIEDIKFDASVMPDKADSTTYQNRVEYSLLSTQRDLNLLDVKRYKTQFLPSVSAFGSSSVNYQNNKIGDLYSQRFPTTMIGLKVNVPIFNGFQRINRLKQAEINVIKSNNTLDYIKNAINLELEQARTQYINSIVSLNSQKQNITLATKNLDVSKKKFESGIGSNIEVTQAQTSLEQAENNYIQALYNTLISKVDMDKASGKIK